MGLLLAGVSHAGMAGGVAKPVARCSQAVVEGELREGESLRRIVVPGRLELQVEAVAGGWVVRVEPVGRGRPEVDFAELATPPYRSVNPLRITTEFGFRAQDAVGWNPRHFRFAADAGMAARMQAAMVGLGRVGSESRRGEAALAGMVERSPEGTVELLDARLIAGTGDQNKAAAMIATHFAETAHRIAVAPDGRTTPLGRLVSLRFRIRLDVPAGMVIAKGLRRVVGSCPAY